MSDQLEATCPNYSVLAGGKFCKLPHRHSGPCCYETSLCLGEDARDCGPALPVPETPLPSKPLEGDSITRLYREAWSRSRSRANGAEAYLRTEVAQLRQSLAESQQALALVQLNMASVLAFEQQKLVAAEQERDYFHRQRDIILNLIRDPEMDIADFAQSGVGEGVRIDLLELQFQARQTAEQERDTLRAASDVFKLQRDRAVAELMALKEDHNGGS